MSLTHVDKLVREGRFQDALQAITKARQAEPQNAYAVAYEERVRSLLKAPPVPPAEPRAATPGKRVATGATTAPLPSPEEQLLSIATPLRAQRPPSAEHASETRRGTEEQRRGAILSKIAEILGAANDFLTRNEYEPALEEIARALVLDPANAELLALEQKVRTWNDEARVRRTEELRLAEERERHAREEKARAEEERIARAHEEQRRREEESRQAAQRRRMDQYLHRSRELLAAGSWREARTELSFVTAIDPSHPVAAALAEEIAQCERTEQERLRQEREEQDRRERLAVEVNALLQEADALNLEGRYGEALHALTRAYAIDPGNPGVAASEQRVSAARNEHARRETEQRRIEEEAEKRRAEDHRLAREDEERELRLRAEIAEAEERRRRDHEEIGHHLDRARAHLATLEFEEALADVALAFILDPFDEDVRLVEQQILSARGTGVAEQQEHPADLPASAEDASRMIAGYLADAGRLMKGGHPEDALRAVLRVRILDPTNDEARHLEDILQSDLGRSTLTVSIEGLSDPSLVLPDLSRFQEHQASLPGRTEAPATSLQGEESAPAPVEHQAAMARPAPFRKLLPLVPVALAGVLGLVSALTGVFSSSPVTTGSAIGAIESASLAQPASENPVQRADESLTAPQVPSTRQKSSPQEGEHAKSTLRKPGTESNSDTRGLPEFVPSTIPGVMRLAKPKIPSDAVDPERGEQLTVKVLVGATGKPVTAMVTSSSNPALDAAVVASVMQSVYQPGEPGQPDRWITIPFSFTP